MTGLVVDTSVLYKANDESTPEHWDAVSLLTKLPGKMSVFVDAEDQIFTEYQAVFAPGIQSLAFLWWQRQSSSRAGICTVTGKLTQRETEEFVRGGCDSDDAAFIGVALRASVPIVHEDGDYEEPCARSLGIVAHRLAEACTALAL